MIELLTKIGIPDRYAGDVLLLIVFIFVSLGLVLLVKKKNLGAVLISVYVAYSIITKSFFDFLENQNFKLSFFVAVVFMIFQIFQRFFKMGISGGKISMWAKIISISLSIVGLLVSVVMEWLPSAFVEKFFSPTSASIFLSQQAQFIWMLVPLILIFLLLRKRY